MRRALIVGIDDYSWSPLTSCVNDANEMHKILSRHEDDMPNFDCRKLIPTKDRTVGRARLKKQIKQLFSNDAEVALLYFSGHGHKSDFGGFLVTQDATKEDEGVSLNDVLIMANRSKAREIIIILDCCYSGDLGNNPFIDSNVSMLREGVSILTSSRSYQVSKGKKNKQGRLTKAICQALEGSASDLLGNITIAGIYAYVDKVFSSWEQRPIFKSHVSTMIPIRKVIPPIELEKLRKLTTYFTDENYEIPLDPGYELTAEPRDPDKEEAFQELQKYAVVGMVKPVGAQHMYYAATESKSCKLTNLGQYYWQLAKGNRI